MTKRNLATDKRPPFFCIEDAVIEDYHLTPLTGWLYVVIVKHINRKTGEAFPSLNQLAKLAGMSRASVIRGIKTLEEKKLIEVTRECVPGTKEREVNHYKLLSATKVVADSNKVVSDRNHVVSEVNNGGITETPQVVSDVDSNHIESNQKNLTIDKPPKSKAAKSKPYHDVDAKVIDQFITTWIAEQPATPLEDHYGNDTTRTIVASLIRAALTTDDLTRYMRVKYKESWWKDKPMNWKHIQQYLPAWAKAHPAKPVTNGTYMDDLSLWRLEDMKRQEEEMRRNAG
jgi:DNA-binding transcriptional regulator YhcF (GntR family)